MNAIVSPSVRASSPHAFGRRPRPSFSPTDLSGLVVWLDAAYGVTDGGSPSTNGGPVGSWQCRLGSLTLAQATSASKPTYVTSGRAGLPLVRFDGVDDVLSGDLGSTLSQPNTILVATKTYVSTTGNIFDGTAGASRHRIVYTSLNRFIMASNTGVTSANDTTNTNWRILAARYNSPSSILRADGASVIAASDTGVAGLGGLTVGAAVGATTSFCQQDVAELLVYNRLLTTTEIKQVEAHLGAKYGVAVAP